MIYIKWMKKGQVDVAGEELPPGYAIIERTEDDDGVFYDIVAYGYETREEAQKEFDAIKEERGVK